MATRYRVLAVMPPPGWKPQRLDDVPVQVGQAGDVLGETTDLLEALSQTTRFNEQPAEKRQNSWAIVVDPESTGRCFPAGRACTPVEFRVMTIWWPDGWEPESALDVPNCARRFQDPPVDWPGQLAGESLGREQALATARALNRQCIDNPGNCWYVVVALENEPLSETLCFDPSGREALVETRRLHVIRPEPDGRGRCVGCPARAMPCAQEAWTSQAQQYELSRSRKKG